MTSDNPTTITIDPPDKYFLHFIKYEKCIYVVGIVGAISQIAAAVVIAALLGLGLTIKNLDIFNKGVIYSGIGIALLMGTSISEILLMHAVKERMVRYIQWWMTSSFVILLFTILTTIIIGFTLFDNALWVTLSFAYLIIRLPFQMYFVDCFAHAEIFHKEPHLMYKSVLYRRFH